MFKHLLILILLTTFNSFAQKSSSEIYVDLQKLHSLKRVLYVAAHPDDENTRLLAYMSLGERAETAYLSLTRGDGGQNLIGNELSEKLGVLRTQELLAARSHDHANQYFSRAVDFGYSKSASESLEKWGEDQILSDMVLVIRKFKPDVIITRFPPDKRGGHGHHTASAMLAIKAFDKAADAKYEPEQVKQFGTWQTTSLYWNTSYWWMEAIEDSAKKYPERYFTQDIGGYNPLLGMSYNEIGTIARSQHKCQGFGAIIERGERLEYFEHLAGEKIEKSFFEHAERSWSSMVNKDLENQFDQLLKDFDFKTPSNNVAALIKIRNELRKIDDTFISREKLDLCDQIIFDCLGLFVEAVADDYSFVSGDSVSLEVNFLNRSERDVSVQQMSVSDYPTTYNQKLLPQKEVTIELKKKINADYSGPYWLQEAFNDLFTVKNKDDLGKAESDPTCAVFIALNVDGEKIPITVPLTYKWRDPSYGERRREVISTPAFTASVENDIQIIKTDQSKVVKFKVHNFSEQLNDKIQIVAPNGWKASPDVFDLKMDKKHQEKWFEFTLTPTKKAENGILSFVDNDNKEVRSYLEIAYDHIPTQVLMNNCVINCIKLDAAIQEGRVAYIKGVQDDVPTAIRQLGFEVDEFEVEQLADLDLSAYQSVVLGIRIYNVHPVLSNYHDKLFKYVENGGNLIMQYNTASRSANKMEFGPKSFSLSRDRVTEEDAVVEILVPDHPIFNYPNKITNDDFNNWVQERGLYFAGEWDDSYQALISWHDTGEEPVKGGLIVTNYGKGQFVYTGISFFRELPKGVVGAYRLFANILSYKK
ncbi:PIG-L family deacetylase [Paracrocinitomix mangrovi]|uniref:PIG-L family deacetylase n=1 Tax=Paracrocinitomix mangrovi TaxID=2862509 RepID=UPI001C8D0753|nr:PIG-L family deacetylase [Paracrocinitomix mangrovi]UKN02357.1 PIG-L family deacetylase [Paracrocinitomix mangrovi]